jgi:hypothetical protein
VRVPLSSASCAFTRAADTDISRRKHRRRFLVDGYQLVNVGAVVLQLHAAKMGTCARELCAKLDVKI